MTPFIEARLGLSARQDTNEDAPAGQGLVEYALLIWFIAIVVFVAIVFLRATIITVYSRIGDVVGWASVAVTLAALLATRRPR